MKKNVIHSIDTKHSEFIDHFEKEEQDLLLLRLEPCCCRSCSNL